MQIRIIAVGKIKEKFLLDGIAEYIKRLRPYVKLTITEIDEEKRGVNTSRSQETLVKEREGDRILAAISQKTYTVALDMRGVQWSSEEFARHLHDREISGKNSIAFIIGGDLGLSRAVLARCDLALSLSTMTFTHQMARLLLLEQIYRAARISWGEPYHK